MRSTRAKNEILRRAYSRCLREYYNSLLAQQYKGEVDGHLLFEAQKLVDELKKMTSTGHLPPMRLAA